MTDPAPVPPASERAVGMAFYLSHAPGWPGRLKATAEEFRVREVSSHPRPDPAGGFTILRIESRGWEQHELADAVARRLGLARRAVAWSGTKDRRAVSERLFSYRGRPPPGGLDLPDVSLLEAYTAREGLVLGRHYANAFEIHVGGIADPTAAVTAYRVVERELREAGGFANFFGPQRFGEVRPITHEVGRWIVRGDLARAVDAYLIDRPSAGSEGPGDDARAAFGAHRDPRRALAEFPAEYRFERALLERLARGDPPERALRALPYELRRLFVHAFQSYLFNRYLSARHAAAIPLDRPVEGDTLVRLGRDGTLRGDDAVPVSADNLAECRELVGRGGAFVAGPLVGSGTVLTPGPSTCLMTSILAEERTSVDAFRVPEAPELASEGTWRALLVPLPPIGVEADATGVWFRFALPKGSYATVLLRELQKTGATPVAADTKSEPGGSNRAY